MQVEPRLYGKLAPKLREMLINTQAKSVEYELIKAAVLVFHKDEEFLKLAKEKLQLFLRSNDPNCNSTLIFSEISWPKYLEGDLKG